MRFWSARDGLDTEAIKALQSRRLDPLAAVEPSDCALGEQLRDELTVSRQHLRSGARSLLGPRLAAGEHGDSEEIELQLKWSADVDDAEGDPEATV